MPGSNLLIRIRGVKCIVVDQQMDEVLLGRPFFKAISIDMISHLEGVKGILHDKHISELEPAVDRDWTFPRRGSKISRMHLLLILSKEMKTEIVLSIPPSMYVKMV